MSKCQAAISCVDMIGFLTQCSCLITAMRMCQYVKVRADKMCKVSISVVNMSNQIFHV